ncbi:MAG: hypothetical protein ACI8QS_003355 [Planctomycetota bacterium]|jgi:hypothetical protein
MWKPPLGIRLAAGRTFCTAFLVLLVLVSGARNTHSSQERTGTWANLIGEPPTLRSLKGRAVVFLFFGPKALESGVNWNMIKAQVEEFKGKVTFLGVYSGSSREAQRVTEEHNLFFPIGTDTLLRRQLGVTEDSYQVMLDRDGGTYWHGPLSGLWNGKIRKGAKGAANVFAEGALFLFGRQDYDGRLGRIAKMMQDGKLAKAYDALLKLRADTKATTEELADEAELSELLTRHVERIFDQADLQISLGNSLQGYEALTVAEKELRKTPLGAQCKERLEELKADEDFQRELDADKDFADFYGSYWSRPPSKWKKKLTYFINNHEGTHAARKARILSTQ